MLSPRLARAVERAADCHEGQLRKEPNRRVPYVTHPVTVGLMLAHHGQPEDVIIAGLLHDTVEDTSLTLEQLREEFGPAVARYVDELTEQDKALPWAERKALYAERLRHASLEAKTISCCDKLHNMQSLIASVATGCDIWEMLSAGKPDQLRVLAEALEIYRGAVKPDLVAEYERMLERVRAL